MKNALLLLLIFNYPGILVVYKIMEKATCYEKS